uniref:Uncharacterized protein n=1 Tax=Tetranychus urticae TaxID=32264 RepID=T1JTG5_TETUR
MVTFQRGHFDVVMNSWYIRQT